MPEKFIPQNETEQIFEEHFEALNKAFEVKENSELTHRELQMEYIVLFEMFEKLLKTSIRISKLGDKAQKKLMKYKDLMDTLRNID